MTTNTNKQDLLDYFSKEFKSQMGLNLADILTLNNNLFSITQDNKLGLSMASLRLDLAPEQHEDMAKFLELITIDLGA